MSDVRFTSMIAGVTKVGIIRGVLKAKVVWDASPIRYDFTTETTAEVAPYIRERKRVILRPKYIKPPPEPGKNHNENCIAWVHSESCDCPLFTEEEWEEVREFPSRNIRAVLCRDELFEKLGFSGHYWNHGYLDVMLEWKNSWVNFADLSPAMRTKVRAGHRLITRANDIARRDRGSYLEYRHEQAPIIISPRQFEVEFQAFVRRSSEHSP